MSSANLTGGGLHGNLELGTVQYQPNVVREAAGWFDELWEESEDFKDELRERLFPEIPQYSPRRSSCGCCWRNTVMSCPMSL